MARLVQLAQVVSQELLVLLVPLGLLDPLEQMVQTDLLEQTVPLVQTVHLA